METRKPQWVRGACIGKGSFGTVSLAKNISNGQIFAVKTVDSKSTGPSAIQFLENEIQTLKSVTCPYIVQYLGDDWTQGSQRNLHIEYVAGGTVADLAAEAELGEHVIRRYTECVLRALCHIHSIGIAHCDVKGRNVLVDPAGTAKLADFGSARRISGQESGGAHRGTPLWMAPEVVRREEQTPASDVWSLGCTVIEMTTGKPPWRVGDRPSAAAEAMFRIGFGDQVPKFPARLSELGKDFLDKCLRRRASERWTCEQLLSHPFVAGSRTTNLSPRSVLEEINVSCQENEEEGDGALVRFDSAMNLNCEEMVTSARERIRRLATEDREIEWESDGWETMRGWASRGVEATRDERENMDLECSDYARFWGKRGWEGNVSFSGAMSCWSCCWSCWACDFCECLLRDGSGCLYRPEKWPLGVCGSCLLFRCKLYSVLLLKIVEMQMLLALFPSQLTHGVVLRRHGLAELQA